MSKFETDGLGNIITKRVTSWDLTSIAESVVLLQLRYVQTPAEFGENENRAFQFDLTPHEALALAEALTKEAQRLLQSQS